MRGVSEAHCISASALTDSEERSTDTWWSLWETTQLGFSESCCFGYWYLFDFFPHPPVPGEPRHGRSTGRADARSCGVVQAAGQQGHARLRDLRRTRPCGQRCHPGGHQKSQREVHLQRSARSEVGRPGSRLLCRRRRAGWANARFILSDNGFETTFNKMHDDEDVADGVFTSICSHSYSHLGISCLFGAKTHEILSTVAQISPLQRNISCSRPGGCMWWCAGTAQAAVTLHLAGVKQHESSLLFPQAPPWSWSGRWWWRCTRSRSITATRTWRLQQPPTTRCHPNRPAGTICIIQSTAGFLLYLHFFFFYCLKSRSVCLSLHLWLLYRTEAKWG